MFAHGHYPTSHYVETYWPPGLGVRGAGKKRTRKVEDQREDDDVIIVENQPFSIDQLRKKKNRTKEEEEFLIFMAQVLDMLE